MWVQDRGTAVRVAWQRAGKCPAACAYPSTGITLSHRGCVCPKPHRVPVQVLWQTFTSLHSHTLGTGFLVSHCSVGQPCALPSLQAASSLSAESASDRKLQVPSGKGCTPLTTPALHTHPPMGSCQHLQLGAERGTHRPFWFFLYEDL